MGLKVDDIKDVVLKCGQGTDISQNVVEIFRKLIANDTKCLISQNNQTPGLWECKWLLDEKDKTLYYSKGNSVWINTDTEDNIINTRKDEISSYIIQNHKLNLKYEKINKSDSQAVYDFFVKVINGTACDGVSALYYLGDITQKAQIRVSRKDHNNEYPNSTAWYDFYEPTTSADNIKMIYDVLNTCTQEQLSTHIQNYHISDINPTTFSDKYLLKESQSIRDNSVKQYFYNHSYFKDMSGFDYVVRQKYDNYSWYRLWSSGYLEQGGFVLNTGDDVLRVTFPANYNYPYANNFYQVGYDTYRAGQVEGEIDYKKRYCATVTPALYAGYEPYQNSAIDNDGNKTYTCVDIMKMDNYGFSFVNSDPEIKSYNGYYYTVNGFRRVTDDLDESTSGTNSIYRVAFYDTLA